ncbi:MAG: extracellular solute-binding protein [Clostridia bacterium]|nr:extracellular solute-binding protein [Clostridia bacterium]
MQKKGLGWLIGIVCLVAVVALIVLFGGGAQDFHEKYEGVDLTADVSGLGREDTYANYLQAHADAPSGSAEAVIDIAAFEGDAELREENGVPCVYTPDGSYVTWKVKVEQAGMYNIQLDYLTTASRGVDIERELYINGELPFSGARSLCFTRLWKDGAQVRQDNQGNDIRPTQVEVFDWQTVRCKDDMGYVAEPYKFYFEAGENTLSFKAVNEPMIIGAISLMPVQVFATYEEYSAGQPQISMSESARNWQVTVQGEASSLRSSPSLYARYDRSSPATEPYSVTNTVLNYIGGDPWNNAGQWIEWQVDVPEDGYYNLSIKGRQAYQRGAISSRMVYIDGEILFDAMSNVAFDYNTSWDLRTLADGQGTPYRFYLTKGSHTIRMEATLGDMGAVLQQMEDSIYRLNLIYRKILVLTGPNPDRFRDYSLEKVYPEVIEAMSLESKRLYKLVDDTVAITGQKSDRVAVAQTLAVQLENFVNHTERITQSFSNFKDNITSLGTAMLNMAETKLDVDLLVISGEKAALPKVHDSALDKLAHEVRSAVASYFVDYNALGDTYDDNAENADKLIEVWITTGRDQSTVLKTMVDDTFTPDTGIRVNVKLVVADTLLTAVVAGNGPDVVLSVGSWFPVNYAMRNAVEDLTQFSDFDEVVKPFYESALASMRYNSGVYALPETQDFPVLFYREDVLEELGLEVPKTWDDLIALLPTIQGNNLSVGVPYPDITNADISILNSLIYQNGGAIYDDQAMRTLIDSENGVAAFKLYTSLYNDYGLPTVYDFVSRFRSGEMPIGLATYSQFNTLSVSAPEIRNLWDFAAFPGTVQTDGTVDNSVHCSGVCCMMIATDDVNVKNNSWEFLKWWVSTETQVRFGREIESVLGSSARYTTANTEALKQLAWSADQLKVLEEQMAHTVGFREIAGGYSTTRHMTNAIRRVINNKEDARETLLTYARTINEEIKVKRREFNLPLYE